MGAWGIGLYSSDFALELRGSVKAVARLPFAPDKLLELLCAMESSTANNPNDSDHTIFWLTVADQFAKRVRLQSSPRSSSSHYCGRGRPSGNGGPWHGRDIRRPRTESGKRRSRRNAIRHGLTAETVIDALQDAA